MKLTDLLNGFFKTNETLIDGFFDFIERQTLVGAIGFTGALAAIYREEFFDGCFLRELTKAVGFFLLIASAFFSSVATLRYWHLIKEQAKNNAAVAQLRFQWISGLIGWPFFLLAFFAAIKRIGQS